ncbi:MAG: hypothetical protein LLF76_07965 [Planctomycetaceae bacterium]|nr:hypothetical protein [Planctomycetaceae bacterium]
MFKWLCCFGRKKKSPLPGERESSVLIKDICSENTFDRQGAAEVVPLKSPDNGAAIMRKKDNAELFTDAVNKLVDKLEGINANLDRQVSQNERLVARMDALPELLASLPQTMDRQEQFLDEISSHVRQRAAHDEVTLRELSGIHEQITSCAQIDATMSEHIGEFARNMDKVNENTQSQTEMLGHLNRSYLTTEQYLRESLQRQQWRFYWLFAVSIGVSLLSLVGLIIALYVLIRQ